jgi:hypothetical protein
VYWEEKQRGKENQGEKKGRGASRCGGASPGSSRRPGEQEVASRSSWELHAPASSWRKRMTCILHKTPWFLGFSRNLKTAQVLVQFNTLYLFKTFENFRGFSAK